jgi:hypothetical protein
MFRIAFFTPAAAGATLRLSEGTNLSRPLDRRPIVLAEVSNPIVAAEQPDPEP